MKTSTTKSFDWWMILNCCLTTTTTMIPSSIARRHFVLCHRNVLQPRHDYNPVYRHPTRCHHRKRSCSESNRHCRCQRNDRIYCSHQDQRGSRRSYNRSWPSFSIHGKVVWRRALHSLGYHCLATEDHPSFLLKLTIENFQMKQKAHTAGHTSAAMNWNCEHVIFLYRWRIFDILFFSFFLSLSPILFVCNNGKV